jgi:3-hydroxyacyl-[acyl-carrier-protein] dehydratase
VESVKDYIPQREPFLFVDKIVEIDEKIIETTRLLRSDESFFQGHFPDKPIMPGVLLCEACFQTGAILMGKQYSGLGVVTKIETTKFKNFARPGDCLNIKVELLERLENAFFMKGTIKVEGKTILMTKFQAAMLEDA